MDIQTRLLQPQTIISIVSFVFGLWVVRATLNSKIKALEEFKKTVDIVDINMKLWQIQADLDWIKRQREQHHK